MISKTSVICWDISGDSVVISLQQTDFLWTSYAAGCSEETGRERGVKA